MASTSPSPETTAELLDHDWLTEHAFAHYPGVRVTGHEVVETLATTATKIRLKVLLEGETGGVPTAICIKAMLDELGAQFSGNGVSVTEARFYSDIAVPLAEAGVLTPPCIFTGTDDKAPRGLVVMHDLVAAGARFLSALSPYTEQEARDSLDQLARFHAATWETPKPYRLPWVGRTIQAFAEKSIVPLDMLQDLMNGPRGDPLDEKVRDARRLHASLGGLATRFAAKPACLVHGDAHAGNLYVLDGRIGLIDWQLLQLGHWAQDVAYHLGAALLPEVRRTHERELLDHYLDRLHAHGGPKLDRDEGWDDYRGAMLYGYYLWAVTRRVEPTITHEFNRRLGLAVAELDSFAIAEG